MPAGIGNGHLGVMPTLLAIVVLGLFLGMRHATDPDHVVAVTTIVSRERTMLHAAIIGALWGLGHTVTILVVGSAIILLKLTILPALGLTMELSVACMLILLGALNLTGLTRRAMGWFAARGNGFGAHAHVILGRVIIHTHNAGRTFAVKEKAAIKVRTGRRSGAGRWDYFRSSGPLAVGIVHGLAGSAAVALLVLTTISQPGWAIGYLLVFGIGTIMRDDADYRRGRPPVHLHAETFFAFESRTRDRLRSHQPELWTVLVLPHRHFRRLVHRTSQLDASLSRPDATPTQYFRRSIAGDPLAANLCVPSGIPEYVN